MGQVLHGGATTTEAVRRAIQFSQVSLRALLKRYGINQKTVAKWRQRTSVADQRTGPKHPRSTVLSPRDKAVIVAFRRHTLLPLDDCLYALQATIPRLTRSSLLHCLQRHDISRLSEVDGDKPKRSRSKAYPLGYFHIDLAEVHTAEGRLYLFVAIDRMTKCAIVELHEKATRRVAGDFLRHLIEAVHYMVHTVLKDATVKRHHYDSHAALRAHLADFDSAYNFARRLKTLRGFTPYETICKVWSAKPSRFGSNPLHQIPGPNNFDERIADPYRRLENDPRADPDVSSWVAAQIAVMPFLLVALIFCSAFATLAASFLPHMVPFTITLEQRAVPDASLSFLACGAGIVGLPITLIYSIVPYRVFKGKVTLMEGYD